ncbi:MAG: hypothetical protein ACAI35_09295 [Candidatus Methylacidiphilales bacterium]
MTAPASIPPDIAFRARYVYDEPELRRMLHRGLGYGIWHIIRYVRYTVLLAIVLSLGSFFLWPLALANGGGVMADSRIFFTVFCGVITVTAFLFPRKLLKAFQNHREFGNTFDIALDSKGLNHRSIPTALGRNESSAFSPWASIASGKVFPDGVMLWRAGGSNCWIPRDKLIAPDADADPLAQLISFLRQHQVKLSS